MLELSLSLALLSSIAASVLFVLDNTMGAYRTNLVTADLDEKGDMTLRECVRHLRSTQAGWLDPEMPSGSEDSWTFQGSTSNDAMEALPGPVERLEFEYDPGDPNDGIDNDGDGLIDEGQVRWTESPGGADEKSVVLTHWVREAPPGEVLGNGLDDDGNGLVDDYGFSIQQVDGRLVIRLTLERQADDGAIITKTMQRTVTLRN